MQLVRKLTIKTCGDFTIKKVKELVGKVDEGQSVSLIRIAGEVVKAETGQTDKGSFTRLGGQFVGTDLTTGELYQSGACILPDFIGAQLGAAVLSVKGSAVQFAFEIHAKRDDSAITGYSYGVKTLMTPEPTDSMKRLMGFAGIQAPALAAPAPAADPAPAPAPAAGKAKK